MDLDAEAYLKGNGYMDMFCFDWAKISIFNILYKIVGDRNFDSIIYF